MTAPSTFKFALACGTAGAYVDVTSDVLFEEGTIPFTDGRTSQFDGFSPGVWSFTLANPTGKYTPGNPATTLATPLSEGMGAVMELDALKLSGTIRNVQLIFPPLESSSKARVRVTVDDMLGNASRAQVLALEDAQQIVTWPLNDAAGSTIAVGQSGVGGPPYLEVQPTTGTITFGVTGARIPGVSSAMSLTTGATSGTPLIQSVGTFPAFSYPDGIVGAWGVWATTSADLVASTVVVSYNSRLPGLDTIRVRIGGSGSCSATISDGLAGTAFSSGSPGNEVPHYYSALTTVSGTAAAVTYTVELFIDGVSQGASSYTPSPAVPRPPVVPPASVAISNTVVGGAAVGVATMANLSHSAAPLNEGLRNPALAGARIHAYADAIRDVTLDTIPTMSSAVYAGEDPSGSSVLDSINDVLRAEQGFMWVETSGTLLSPTPKVKVAARDRGRAVDYSFDVSEILDPIPFVRSLANTVRTFTVNGPINTATYDDPSLFPLVGSASSSESSPLRDYVDLFTYASDRVYRGAPRGISVPSITIDATSPSISRWADLTAIRPGFRLHITGLPSTQLGYSTWDGFVVGREIVNTQSPTGEPKTLFTFHLAPVTNHIFTLDTDVLAAGGNLTLTSGCTNSATSISVTSSDGSLLSTAGGDYPLTFRLENECITITAVSGSSSPQTITATRGVTDPLTGLATSAVTHAAAVPLLLADPAYIEF